MARKPRAPFDPSKLSDRPGSITPAQFAILLRMGTLLSVREQQGKNVADLSQREASLLLGQVSASRGEARATAAQIKYLHALGAMFPDDINKAEASALIGQMKGHAIPNNRRTNSNNGASLLADVREALPGWPLQSAGSKVIVLGSRLAVARQRLTLLGYKAEIVAANDEYGEPAHVVVSARRTNGKLVWVSNHPFYGNKRKHFTAQGQGGEFLVQPISRGGGWSVSWSDRTHTARVGYFAKLADAKRAAENAVVS